MREAIKDRKVIDLRFGRLVVKSLHHTTEKGRPFYTCECDCGKSIVTHVYALWDGGTKSCGCLSYDTAIKTHTKHGLYQHKLYRVWTAMKKRCYNPKDPVFKYYGERGITVCDKWIHDFQIFYNFAIKLGWKEGLEIDRRNNNGNYTPENCRFVEKIINTRNTRRSRWWFVFGKKYPSVSSASKAEGVCIETIRQWCGMAWNNGHPPVARKDCYAILKYGEEKCL